MKKRISEVLIFIGFFLLTIPAASAVTGQLWLQPFGGSYVDSHPDSWLEESWTIGNGNFDLNITNHHQQKTLSFIYIITAVNADPAGLIVNVNNIQINDWTPAITGTKITVPTSDNFEYPPHGIYQTGTYYNITKIMIPGGLAPNNNMTIPIYTSPQSSNVKIHFDGVGADDSNEAVVFVPPSHDATSQIPEFPTIALPVAAIIGLVFFFQFRRKKEE